MLRLLRTVSGITADQLWFQVYRRAQGRAHPRAVSVTPPSEAFLTAFAARLRACPPPPDWDGRATADAALQGRWELLGEWVTISPTLDWSQRVGRPLHSFHLQYHEQLRALARHADSTDDPQAVQAISAVITRWIETTRAGTGDAWHPYPISVRVFAWLEVLALVGAKLDSSVRAAMVASLASQLDVLVRRRERQIGANHLQRNDAALALGGMAFTGPAAAQWRDVGLAGLWHALDTHVLDDGMHYERSPMYHAGMLADVLRVLEVCRCAGISIPDRALARVPLMVNALQRMTRADGTLHQFNDTAAGIAPPTAWLIARAAAVMNDDVPAPASGAWVLPAAGYAGWSDTDAGVRIVVDAGPAGPREQPGHAQCDALSVEMCIDGEPVLVNAGVHGYDGDPYREFSRSVRGHNTVQVGGREQHEVWATFRVARFGRVTGPTVHAGEHWSVLGRVDGYAGGTHERRVELIRAGMLRLTDTVSGGTGETATGRLLFHPDYAVTLDGASAVARKGNRWVRVTTDPVTPLRLARGVSSPAEGWHFPTFGSALPATCVLTEAVLPAGPIVTTITWGTD